MYNNTMGTLDSVPVALRGYYAEETRSEPTGEMVSEEYTFVDENGDEQTGIREVPEFHDVTYTVLLPFGETKSWNEVDTVVSMGKASAVIKQFIKLAINGDHKEFHNSYIQWLSGKPSEPVRTRNDDGTYVPDDLETPESEAYEAGYTPEMYAVEYAEWEVTEPSFVVTDTTTYYRTIAKAEREIIKESDIRVGGFMWQVAQADRDNMSETIGYAERNSINVDDTTNWITADNRIVAVSYKDLQDIKNAYVLRMDSLFKQYGIWVASGMQEPIEWDL